MSAENAFFYDSSDIADRSIWRYQNGKSHCSIAKVVAINNSPASVNIQPLVNYFDQIAGWQPYPVLEEIPVIQNQTATYSIKMPLNVGDTGIVLWFDREVFSNLSAGATSSSAPDSGNLTDQNACVFMPILPAFSLANPLKQTGVDFVSGGISLTTQLENLCSQLTTLISKIELITVGPGTFVVGSDPVTGISTVPLNISAFTPIVASINLIKTNLTTFKGAQ